METELPIYLYHGTSLHDFRMLKINYNVTNLYAGDNLELAIEIAKRTAKTEQSSPVIIVLDRAKISHLIAYGEAGCFSGNIRSSIIRAYICDNGEVGLKL